MTFGTLALVSLAGLAGPLLQVRAGVPVVLGELLAGVLLGRTGLGVLDSGAPGFADLAQVGFALVMFVAGTHVPLRDPALLAGTRTGLLRVLLVAAAAAALGTGLAAVAGTGHGALYAVLLASSSAALVLPAVAALPASPAVLALLPQVAAADVACIVALPLVLDPARAGRAAVGALVVAVAAGLVFLGLRRTERSGVRRRLHRLSRRRGLALELRTDLALLFGLAALAVAVHVPVLLAGFAFGLAVSAVGEPRRLGRQLFALTEGFLGPVFFLWLGASLDVRALGGSPGSLALGLALGAGAVLVHLVPVATGQPAALAVLAAAQLGVPVAAAALGTELGVLRPGEAPALVLGALVTVAAAALAARQR